MRDGGLLKRILDHPAAETDRAFGYDQHRFLPQVFHMIFHFSRKQVRADAQTAVDRQGMVAHTHFLIFQPPVYHADQVTVHLPQQAILAFHPVTIPG